MQSASSPSLPLPTRALSRINTGLAPPWGNQEKEQARREHGPGVTRGLDLALRLPSNLGVRNGLGTFI